jgi:hypothetical protein
MANNLDLVSIYEQNYLNPQSSVIVEKKEEESPAEENDGGKAPVLAKNKKKKKPFDAGACYNEEKNSFNNLFNTFMEEFDSGENAFDDNGSDDSFEFDGGEGEDDGLGGDDDQSFTLTELKAMTLQEICDLISGTGTEDDGMGDDFSFDDGDDSIPTESYGQMGDGKHLGNTQTRDGKPSKQSPTTRVKGNGDADFSKQKTGYAPENTEGSEGENFGNTQTRDGKPSKQGASSHVKPNGDAKVGQTQRTGFGKKEGERLF